MIGKVGVGGVRKYMGVQRKPRIPKRGPRAFTPSKGSGTGARILGPRKTTR